MTDQMLIVARMAPMFADTVSALFAASDAGELPRRLGVTRRSLFRYHGLYFHCVEFAGDHREAMRIARDDPEFRRLSDELRPFVTPFDPSTWRSPADAMAECFYHWTPAGAADGR